MSGFIWQISTSLKKKSTYYSVIGVCFSPSCSQHIKLNFRYKSMAWIYISARDTGQHCYKWSKSRFISKMHAPATNIWAHRGRSLSSLTQQKNSEITSPWFLNRPVPEGEETFPWVWLVHVHSLHSSWICIEKKLTLLFEHNSCNNLLPIHREKKMGKEMGHLCIILSPYTVFPLKL